jgi:hypothetical protein
MQSPFKNTNNIFHRIRKTAPKICMEAQKILESQSKSLGKREMLEAS